ncbi:Protein trichome birefringence-like [Actinidia chinensis var. chinensis]|uniref:Protein trichome birefringence-like n=1 Tax=Actinidia chinensis var. chinensis TaxID=1590841 RepID=A0A2R6QTI4_ACTCC|nr:Protein trichome birefringence-like [Actinidia chinensis var. chinensis]
MFVGDSLSLNQWQSLTCMLHKAVPLVKYELVSIRGLSIFKFPAYNVSIMFWRNGLLVDVVNEKIGRVLKLDSLENGDSWKTVDILIFHSWHWWHFTGSQQRWDFFQEGNITYKDMDRLVAYRKGLSTWARWVDSNIDPIKTQVFFQGVSPDHDNASDWGDPNAKNCIGQQKPVLQRTYPGGRNLAEVVVEKVLRKMSTSVYLLNVTTLSQFRKDGHPSIYGYGGHRGSDCIHWCLPGVPDAWNDLLYKALFYNA